MIDVENKLKVELQSLIGKECWSVVAGESTGSNISLDIGEKIPRKEPLNNRFISEDARNYDAEYDLYVLCSWRIDSETKVICGALDDNSQNGKMLQGLNQLTGAKILEVNLSKPAYDLTVAFSNSLTLRIFCDQTNEEVDCENYMFFTHEEILTISNGSQLEVEPR